MMDTSEFKQRFETYKKDGIKAVYDRGKILPKYDEGTDDKTYLPEYEYDATVTPQGTSLEKHKRITNEEDWLKYWGDVGAGYVNKALESVAKPILEGLKTASYFTPLGNATAFGDFLAANINGDKDELLASGVGLLPTVKWGKGITGIINAGKLSGIKNPITTTVQLWKPTSGTGKLIRDVYLYPREVIKARKTGSYPLTFSERRKYITRLNNEANDAWAQSVLMQNELAEANPGRFYSGSDLDHDWFRPEVHFVSDKTAKNFKLDEDALANFSKRDFILDTNNSVPIRRRRPNSLLPRAVNGPMTVKSTLAHEFNHAFRSVDGVQPKNPYYGEPMSIFDKDVGYFVQNPNYWMANSLLDILNAAGTTGLRTAWQRNPEEFLSEYRAVRSALGKGGVASPNYSKMLPREQERSVNWLSWRFNIAPSDAKKYLELLSFFYGYDKGKSIHIKPANRGKFKATMKRTGKTAEQLKHSKNPLTRKRAIFALNSRKFKH